MADDVRYTLDIAISELKATCSCGRLTLTFHSEPSAAEKAELAEVIKRHKERYPQEEHAFAINVKGTPQQAHNAAHSGESEAE